MSKILKLEVKYDALYGEDVYEYMLLPSLETIKDVLFPNLEIGIWSRDEVFLGEIEGKHSQCYGDIMISYVDSDELSMKEMSELITCSNYGIFEGYLENIELSDEDMRTLNSVIDELSPKDTYYYSTMTSLIYQIFINQLKDDHLQSFSSISILEKDYYTAVSVLESAGIKVFE